MFYMQKVLGSIPPVPSKGWARFQSGEALPVSVDSTGVDGLMVPKAASYDHMLLWMEGIFN